MPRLPRVSGATRAALVASLLCVPILSAGLQAQTQGYVRPDTRPSVAPFGTPEETMQAVAAEAARVVPEGGVRDLTVCKLQDALWGGYDVDVHVTMGADGLPHLFQLQKGRFSRLIDPQPKGGASSRFERTGRVQPPTAAEAFARGVPYFVQQAVVEAPGVLRLTVLSNPTSTEDLGIVFVAVDDEATTAEYDGVTLPIEPAPEPQTLRLQHKAFGRAAGTARIAILRGTGRAATIIGCIVSNEVDVGLGG